MAIAFQSQARMSIILHAIYTPLNGKIKHENRQRMSKEVVWIFISVQMQCNDLLF
jgi:hypothetical protein